MNKSYLALVAAGMLLVATPAQAQQYLMNPGDQLQIIIVGHEDLSSTGNSGDVKYIVRPDGKVSFPLIGDVDTTGKTVADFTAELSTRLREYIITPDISVNIAKLGTTRVFVLGEVKKAGLHELTKSHRILDAIGAAEGFTKDAAKKKIYLIRDGQEANTTLINLNDYITKGDLSQNVVLKEGDCLYLTSNGRLDFTRDIFPFISAYYYIDRISNNNDD